MDFYCSELCVVIEIDGESHGDKMEYDTKRDEFLQGLGLRVIHLNDLDIKRNLDGVMEFLEENLCGKR